ncbi:high mobility group B protein 10 isoform X3 [Vitis riparia]|uniref:high mobility group B protein 10 isoform X3 n=1 Tax=Vitis riparia TaxID=96939 RepID=UPI00155A66EF|nr:high mobility group B protein 10 isoform X3 [Vitis riparia]
MMLGEQVFSLVPTTGGKALDLHRLFVEVTSRGGLEKVHNAFLQGNLLNWWQVIRDRKWKEVTTVFKFPTTITSASFVLRKYYLSLLHHYEQVYYFRKQSFPISMADPLNSSPINGSATTPVFQDSATTNDLPVSPRLQPGCLVTGTIDGKFDNGYLVSVNLGSDVLKGVLYHIPNNESHMSRSSNASAVPPPRNWKRSQLALRDPSRPKRSQSGYNFFFAENYARLKPLYSGQERAISKKIGFLWNKLTDAEKQVYQEKGMIDKERYKTEMLEYRSAYDSKPQ